MENTSKTFTVIIGDLVRSRAIGDRAELSLRIQSVIERVAQKFKNAFYAPLVPTRGMDEYSGVLKSPKMGYRVCRFINSELYPHSFRFAIVRNALDVHIAAKDARLMDGPAFHIAADLMVQAKKEDLYYCFHLGFADEDVTLLLNELVNFIHIIRKGWTSHQCSVITLYESLENQSAVARKLRISQQAVSDALKQAHWKEVSRAEGKINQILEECGRNK